MGIGAGLGLSAEPNEDRVSGAGRVSWRVVPGRGGQRPDHRWIINHRQETS